MPRKGSLQFKPRKRAKKETPRIRSWVEEEKVRLQGFPVYKAFMTHFLVVDAYKNSPTHNQEVFRPVTILEAPPVRIFSIRAYIKDSDTGYLKTWKEVYYLKDVDPRLHKRITLPKEFDEKEFNKALEEIESNLDKLVDIRVLVYTRVALAGFPKKTPDITECYISGKSLEDKLNYIKQNLGKDIKFSENYEEKEYVDVFAVTKGKGFQGAVKRWGKKIQKRKHKLGKVGWKIGSVGPRGPQRVMWTVPFPGQLGYHTRCEYNKVILKMSDNPEEINPSGGIPHYGIIRTSWIALYGSVPGPSKRLVRIRPAIRPPKGEKFANWVGDIVYISKESLLAR